MKRRREPWGSCCAKKCIMCMALEIVVAAVELGVSAENSLESTTRAAAKRKYLNLLEQKTLWIVDLQDEGITMWEILSLECGLYE